MKYVAWFLWILVSLPSFSQKAPGLEAKVVYKNSADTIITEILVRTNFFDKTLIDPCSVISKPVFTEGKAKSTEINYISFIDPKNNKRVFVPGSVIPGNRNKKLIEVMYDGRIKWYRLMNRSTYDRSCVAPGFLVKDGQKTRFPAGNQPRKKVLKQVMNDRQDLFPAIDSILQAGDHYTKKEADIRMVLRAYDN